LIKDLLEMKETKRPSGTRALQHPWFKKFKNVQVQHDLNPNVMNKLRSFRGVSRLRLACLNMLVKMAEPKEIKELKEIFEKIDADDTGLISASELAQALK
jgi:calcium-dependent protein kinase